MEKKTKKIEISVHGDGWNEVVMDMTDEEIDFLNRLSEELKLSSPYPYAPLVFFNEKVAEGENL